MAEIVLKNAAMFNGINFTKIDVFSRAIGEKIDRNSRITNATLILEVSSVSGDGFYVKAQANEKTFELIDYISPSSGSAVFINITEEINEIIKNNNAKVVLQIDKGITFNKDKGIELKLEYIPERVMYGSNEYYDVSVQRGGSGKVNLATGALSFTHADSEGSGISHVYNTWQAGKIGADFDYPDISIKAKEDISKYGDYGCGKGWKLNLHQYLIKRNGTSNQDLYTYVDGSGNYHEFAETYYYMSSEVKIYLDKNNVETSIGGKLTYDGADVKIDLKSTSGLILQTDYQGFAGSEKLELRSEDRARIEEDIESLTRSINDCKFAKIEYSKTETGKYKALIAEQKTIEETAAMLERKSLNAHDDLAPLMGRRYNENQEKGLFYCIRTLENLLSRREGNGDSILISQQAVRSLTNKTEELKWDIASVLNHDKNRFLNLQENFSSSKASYSKDEEARQKVRNEELIERADKDLIKACNLIEYKKYELACLVAEEPVRYIMDGNGLIMGFNDAGVLMIIADAYENVTRIIYEKGKAVSVKKSNGKETRLEYEDGYLSRIIDEDEKVVSFDYYSNATLAAILYSDGTSSDFSYTRDTVFLNTIKCPSGYGVKFTYGNQKIQKIEETTQTYEITDNGWRGFNSKEEELENGLKLLASIKYNTHLSTTCTNRMNDRKTYVFDLLGKPATVYEGDYDDKSENTKSLSIDYNGTTQTFSIEDNIFNENLLNKINAVQLQGNLPAHPKQTARKVYEINIADLSELAANYVFSAWVKADSAYVKSERRTSYSSNHETANTGEDDIYKLGRKFELRAELEYLNEKSEIEKETCSASFDWLNTDWQYLALPIGVRQDDKIGDRIVGRFPLKLGGEDRKLVKLNVIIDYTYNVNGKYNGGTENSVSEHAGLFFDCVTFREGDWTLSKLDAGGKASYTEESSGNITFYDYDKNGNVVKSTVKDKKHRAFVNTYEYNKQDSLLRSTDFNGICEEAVLDDKGRELKKIVYNICDPSSKLYSESVRDDKGKVIAEKDITGEFNGVQYEFDNSGDISVAIDAEGNKTAYGYHNNNFVSISGTCGGNENSNTLKHTLGYATRVSSGGTDYTYTYDGWGRQKAIAIAGINYSSVEYISDLSTKITLSNGDSFVQDVDGKETATTEITLTNGEKFDCKTLTTLYSHGGEDEMPQSISYIDNER